ncbi:formate C-acetyltransferase [Oscillibacter sp. PC13]|uniref:pyruvate formate lyase family protein n=1 Tax=Oscillibacter sp. PC13 TaxID=1855299 RepID=UPI0008EA8C7A|nr:pyruvate formate lyase family protein [Oscillibacter sp. PC13]SFP88308.1 formate C-acetyltransferase [Oscillibacter sp. PC13]
MTISRWQVPEVQCSPRICRIRDHRIEDHDRSQIPHRDRVYREEFAKYPDEVAAMRFARGFSRFLAEKKIHLNEYDLLAGFAYRYTYNTTLPINMPSDYDPRYRPDFGVESAREAKECEEFHGLKPGDADYEKMETFSLAVKNWLFKHWESGHILPGYHTVVSKGYGALIREGEAALAKADAAHRPYVEAMLMCNRAASAYIRRYEALAAQLAEQAADPACKAQLQQIAQACGHIAEGVPQTFFEAVQLIWLTHELLYAENEPASISLGRLDQTLYPFYERDVAEGRLTYEEASDYIDALWIKFSANLHAYQNVTIGGMGRDGHFTANPVTYIILQATRRLRFDQPLISLRYNDDMPDPMWAECMALIKTGIGFPAFFYDGACIPAKLRMGIAEEDARNYGLIGCVEMGTPGKEYAKTEVLRINMPMILQLMMNHGRAALTGDLFPLKEEKDLDSIKSFEEFYAWYRSELLHFGGLAMDCINLLDESVMHYYPTPFLSVLMDQCYEKGLDVTGGGTVYNNSGVNLCGMANVVDSLSAIRKVVFEEKRVSLSQLAEAMQADYTGHEDLQNELTKHCPKFGNDLDAADDMMNEIVAGFAQLVDEYRNPRGGKFQLGLYSVEDHAKMGLRTGATPDGRNARVSLANALSPVQGRDQVGPTAVVNSVLKTDLRVATNGMVLDLKFNPSFLKSDRHMDALRDLIDTYFHSGGMEIQFNVVDRATLMDAQEHPEKHQNLVVRVSGFSAYFTTLMKTTQDEIIARTEYANM